ncbi:hypothetical protein L0F63_002008 [Massospora cicadina]|nr:hypothetical protein L0F63_002008 [Massospora cicadina]
MEESTAENSAVAAAIEDDSEKQTPEEQERLPSELVSIQDAPIEVQVSEKTGVNATVQEESFKYDRSSGSNNSTVIIDVPVMEEFVPSTGHEPTVRTRTYLLPTKSQVAKKRDAKPTPALIKQAASPCLKKGEPFSLAATMRMQGNVVPSRFLTKPAPTKGNTGPKHLTRPRSPILATKSRKRATPPIDDNPAPPQFKALPLNKKIFEPHSCQGVPRVVPQSATIPRSPKFSKPNRPKSRATDSGANVSQVQSGYTRPSSALAHSNAKRAWNSKPPTIPVSPKLQTKLRFGLSSLSPKTKGPTG